MTRKKIEAKSVEEYENILTGAMQELGTWRESYAPAVHVLAGVLRRYEQARQLCDESLIITEKSREGDSRQMLNPAFQAEKVCADQVRRYLGELGLLISIKSKSKDEEVEAGSGASDDPLNELNRIVTGVRKRSYKRPQA